MFEIFLSVILLAVLIAAVVKFAKLGRNGGKYAQCSWMLARFNMSFADAPKFVRHAELFTWMIASVGVVVALYGMLMLGMLVVLGGTLLAVLATWPFEVR